MVNKLSFLFHTPTWHIRRGDNAKAGNLDGYPLLAFRTHYAADDAFEWAGGDNDLVATLEAAFSMLAVHISISLCVIISPSFVWIGSILYLEYRFKKTLEICRDT